MAQYETIRPPRKRGRGIYWLVALVTLFVAGVMTYAFGIDRKPLYQFDHYDRPTYVSAPDPISAALKGTPPHTTIDQKSVASVEVRAIDVRANGVALIAGGRQVRFIKRPGITNLLSLTHAVSDASWITSPLKAPTLVRIYAALIVEPGVTFTVGGTGTQTVQMVNLPGVFIGVKHAALNFQNVHVTAVTEQGVAASAGAKSAQFRPFVVADERSTMNATKAVFTGLGYDWNASYGVSWMDGSSGTSSDSTYEDGFIGVYTDHATGITFTGDAYRNNALYGLDPHSGSTDLHISGCTAEGNGAHGIIFSDHVVHSQIKGCTSRGNGENGIMMDLKSDANIIEGNSVIANHGDGIVLSNSPGNGIFHNTIHANRVGIQASPHSEITDLDVTMNIISDNAVAGQGVKIDSSNAEHGNGGQWRPVRAAIVFTSVVLVGLLWLIVTVVLRRRRGTDRMSHVLIRGPGTAAA
jgi:mannuronan 5-epimerase